jgi:hypothetical protein
MDIRSKYVEAIHRCGNFRLERYSRLNESVADLKRRQANVLKSNEAST